MSVRFVCPTVLAVLATSLLLSTPNFGDTLLVPEDYETIQEALDVAAEDDTVSVAEGEYVENLVFDASGVTLLSRDPLGATIDGDGSDCVKLDAVDGSVVGFILTNGNRGVFARDATVEITGNLILNNEFGIDTRDVTATIANNVITSNVSNAIVVVDGIDVAITNNTLRHHVTNVIVRNSDVTFTNNISANASTGVHVYVNDATLVDQIDVAAQSLPGSAEFTANYNLNWNNGTNYRATATAPEDPFGFPPISVTNNIDPGGEGELDEDPVLDTIGGYQILVGSPCIDAGDNNAVPESLEEDVVGEDRFTDDLDTDDTGAGTAPIVDIGAFEFQEVVEPTFIRGDANANGVLTIADAVTMLLGLYVGGEVLCDDSFDATDNGILDVADPIAVLELIFLDGPDLAEPYPDCGVDGTDDDLGCQTLLFCDE